MLYTSMEQAHFLIVFPLLSVRSSLESRCPHNMPWSFLTVYAWGKGAGNSINAAQGDFRLSWN